MSPLNFLNVLNVAFSSATVLLCMTLDFAITYPFIFADSFAISLFSHISSDPQGSTPTHNILPSALDWNPQKYYNKNSMFQFSATSGVLPTKNSARVLRLIIE